MTAKKSGKVSKTEISDYDEFDTSDMINISKPLRLEDIGIRLPKAAPTQVISIRLPSRLLNEIKAMGSQKDIPYQALIKLFLAESVEKAKKKSA